MWIEFVPQLGFCNWIYVNFSFYSFGYQPWVSRKLVKWRWRWWTIGRRELRSLSRNQISHGSRILSNFGNAACHLWAATNNLFVLNTYKHKIFAHWTPHSSNVARRFGGGDRIHTEYTKVQFCRHVNPIQLSKQRLLKIQHVVISF